ncbi:MAG: hypothetical protein P4M12_10030 [Gammaproteobacteria bacterium]|nr:hypothetical protein [Gammaproteobacteria bacterium]
MNTKKMIGMTLATAAAAAFMITPITSTAAQGAKKFPCYGVNGCKGKNGCSSDMNGCAGKNACKSAADGSKATSVTMMTKKACKKAGGSLTE